MPGAGFKRKARIWREEVEDMVAAPFMAVKEALVSEICPPPYHRKC